MQAAKANDDEEFSYIYGRNFHGQISLKGNLIRLSVTEFEKGSLYVAQITNSILEKEFRRFLIFKKVEDLFRQLVVNKNLEISDENALMLPIEVTFKEKNYELKVEIPLELRKFNNQGQKIQILLQQLQKITESNKVHQQRQKICEMMIKFNGDEANANYKQFQFNQQARTLKYLNNASQWMIFNHQKALAKQGIYSFKVKIIKTTYKSIFLGVCGKNIKSQINAYLHNNSIGLLLSNGNLYGIGANKNLTQALNVVEGKSIYRVVIDMNRKFISWFQNDQLLCRSQLWKEMEKIELCPFISLCTFGDIVELIYP